MEQHMTGIGLIAIHSECLTDLEEILLLTEGEDGRDHKLIQLAKQRRE